MRIEPAPSEPSAAPTRPAATAAALPPLEPPGARCRSHGLRVAPNVAVSVNGHSVSSGTFVLPMITAPASRRRRTTSASARAGLAVRVRAERRQLAGDVDVVLDRDRHAQQRARVAAGAAARVGLVGFQPRALGEHDAERVQRAASSARDPLEVQLDELARGDLAGGDQLGLAGDSGVGEIRWRPSAGAIY